MPRRSRSILLSRMVEGGVHERGCVVGVVGVGVSLKRKSWRCVVSKKSKKANAKLSARVSAKLKEKKVEKGIVGVGAGREVGKAPVDAKAPAAGAHVGLVSKPAMSGLDAAAKVLGESGVPLNCPAIIEAVFKAGYWTSNGKRPAATIHTAIVTEITKKGDKSRFVKVGRGLFKSKAV